jgi:hypothetical protein
VAAQAHHWNHDHLVAQLRSTVLPKLQLVVGSHYKDKVDRQTVDNSKTRHVEEKSKDW